MNGNGQIYQNNREQVECRSSLERTSIPSRDGGSRSAIKKMAPVKVDIEYW